MEQPGILGGRTTCAHDAHDRKRAMIGILQARRGSGEDLDDPVATLRALELAGFAAGDVRKAFGSLGNLERAAGLIAIPSDQYRQPDTLLADLHRVARALRRVPGRGEYEFHGRFSEKAFRRRFGGGQWTVALAAFGRYLVRNHGTHLLPPAELARLGVGPALDTLLTPAAPGEPGGSGVVAPVSETDGCATVTRAAERSAAGHQPRRITPPLFGAPITHGTFVNAPVNEQSTVGLFCCLAAQLGIVIRHVDDRRFPDIWALRRVPGRDARFQDVRIEVQFRSRDFVRDGHDANEVDILVCYEDNWPERPPQLELIELRRVLQDQPPARAVG